MLCGGETGEIDADLGDQRRGHGATDTGDGVQSRHGLRHRLRPGGDLGTDRRDARIEEVEMVQLLRYQEALVNLRATDTVLPGMGTWATSRMPYNAAPMAE